MSPDVICSNPAIMRKVVVLPQPDGPSSTTNSPSLISIETLATTTELPNDLVTCWREMLILSGTDFSLCFQRVFPVLTSTAAHRPNRFAFSRLLMTTANRQHC